MTLSFWVYSYCGNMTSYWFFKMAAVVAQYYFRFRICWCPCLQKVKIYQQTKISSTSMVNIISIYGWDITTSGLEKQMSTIFEFYFRFRSRPFFCNQHFILHQPAEFRPNRSSHCGNTCITSYRFIKMAAANAKYYFPILLPSEGQSLWANQISSTYLNWWLNLTTSVFEKQTSAILEFYFRFWSRPLSVISMSFCITLPNFVQIGAPTAEIWHHCHFSTWRAVIVQAVVTGCAVAPALWQRCARCSWW